MRALLTFIVGFLVITLGNYWFNPYLPICRLPVTYSIGDFDEAFGISREEALTVLKDAEAVWEESLGRDDVFLYAEDGSVKVNFIYDERQREAERADKIKRELSIRGEANEVLVELHGRLVAEYDANNAEYQKRLSNYESNQNSYNAKVESYNEQGGAPPDVYEELERERERLERERQSVNALAQKLNDLANQINEIGEKGNELVGEYNEQVDHFNDNFAHGHEYTQGDYKGRNINIYSFVSKEELLMVLAHELGHSLAIGHVENPESLMYYLLDEQPYPARLTDEDKEAFMSACGGNFGTRLLGSFKAVYNGLII